MRDKKKSGLNCSPSPTKKVIGKHKVTPEVRRLFIGFALEKKIKTSLKGVSRKTKTSQIVRKSIGSRIIRKCRIQRELKNILPYKFKKHTNKMTSADDITKFNRNVYSTVKVKDSRLLQQFYEDDTVSKICPEKKDVVKAREGAQAKENTSGLIEKLVQHICC